ncbi:MAG TPA: hypothetical protein VHV08_01475 [Pirellulales bacterium]|nr:hypothetical protein [Pirellulales bacterium]
MSRASNLSAERQTLYRDYRVKLDQLAAWCRERRMEGATDELQEWLPERKPDQWTLFVLSKALDAIPSDESLSSEWRQRWRVLREGQAEELFALARRALAEHQPSLAYELATETVRENPDHKQARRLLGYVKQRDQWRTPFEIRQLGSGKVWNDKFGWLPKSHVDRYEKGQRYYQGHWISAADEAAQRRDVKHGWRVDSAHYVVTTDHSLEEGVQLSRRLEMLYQVWQQVFISFSTDEAELARRFEGRTPRGDVKQHEIVYYRTRAEYNAALRPQQAKIDITLGIYLDQAHTAYFFAGDEQDTGTVYHEATHQLFQETRPAAPDVGWTDNFWIVEGIACYMESLATERGYCTLGGMAAGRMPAARHRLLADHFYVPLNQLVQLGMEGLQRDPNIAKIYSQSAGLADFLMHFQNGRYAQPLVRYLEAIYAGRATARTLSELTASSYETLDRQYRDYMSQDGTPASDRR